MQCGADKNGACPEIGFLQKLCLNGIIVLLPRFLRGVFAESKKRKMDAVGRKVPGKPSRPTAIHLSGIPISVGINGLPSAGSAGSRRFREHRVVDAGMA